MIAGCKSIAEYAIRKWMADHRFVDSKFQLEVKGNKGIITDCMGEKLILEYDPRTKKVEVRE